MKLNIIYKSRIDNQIIILIILFIISICQIKITSTI
jgi:hypothetical protein